MTQWIISSCVLLLVVIALRYLLRGKISLRMQYALWLLVLVRLLVQACLVANGWRAVLHACGRWCQSCGPRGPRGQLSCSFRAMRWHLRHWPAKCPTSCRTVPRGGCASGWWNWGHCES